MTTRWILALALLTTGCERCGADPVETGDTETAVDPWAEAFPWAPLDPHPCPPDIPEGDPMVDLLSALGLELSGVGIPFDYYDGYGGYIEDDPTRLSWFHDLQEDVTLIPCTAANFAGGMDHALLEESRPLTAAIAEAAARIDLALEVGGYRPRVDSELPLVEALATLNEDDEDWDRASVEEDAAALPLELRAAAARLLLAAADARTIRNRELRNMHEEADAGFLFERFPHSFVISLESALDPDNDLDLPFLAPEPEHAQAYYRAATQLAQVLDEEDWTTLAELDGDFGFRASTPLGQLILGGTGDDVYDPSEDESLGGPVLVSIDLGGDDIWRIPVGATSDEDNPVSLHVDLGGSDHYGYLELGSPYDQDGLLPSDADGRYGGGYGYGNFTLSKQPRQGAGIVGYGFLLDLGDGDDVYRSLRFSQGYAALGVGVLYDQAGDDDYEAEAASQAAGYTGIALLIDRDGSDRYRSFTASQAHAHQAAYALLWDQSGDDVYDLEPDEPFVYLWYEGFGHNISVGQGCAQGYRAGDYLNEVHLSGGVALLRDLEGDDDYMGSVMVQGNGYWAGFGILADAQGHDRYNGYNYVQGATEHFALAALLEGDGDDVYNDALEPTHSSVGLGHDYSVTFTVDDAGDDIYLAPDRGLGAGKCHGMGVFVDNRGNDAYEGLADATIGWATDYDWAEGTCGDSTTIPTYGFFVDAGGADTYVKPDPTGYGDDILWISDDTVDEDALELGGGIDTESAPCWARAYGAAWQAEQGE